MANLLAKLILHVKDYKTKEEADTSFVGEVVSVDSDLKTNIYRFFETDSGTLMVSIDYKKEKVIIQERSDNVHLTLELEEGNFGKCIYSFDANNTLNLESRAWEIKVDEDHVYLDYDLYAPNDHDKPMTRNIVEIKCEVKKPC